MRAVPAVAARAARVVTGWRDDGGAGEQHRAELAAGRSGGSGAVGAAVGGAVGGRADDGRVEGPVAGGCGAPVGGRGGVPEPGAGCGAALRWWAGPADDH